MITVMYSNYAPSPEHLRRLEQLIDGGIVTVAHDAASALADADATRIVLGHRYLRQLLPHAPRLRWVQTTAAGVDQLPWRELAERGIVLTRNPLNASAIAHHAIALAWSLLRRLPQAAAAQRSGQWAAPFPMLPLPRSALVLGLGAIGLQAARLLRGLGLRVRATARSASPEKRAACDELLPPDRWRDALADTDVLILSLPLDPATRGCVGVRELAALPAHAVLVNVGRAGLIDHAALIDALRDHRLGGAGLDVLDPVPAADDPLWHTPNLLITAKAAAFHPGMQSEFETFAEAQLRHYIAGEPLAAIVQPSLAGSS